MHNYMTEWWRRARSGENRTMKLKTVNLDRYDFYGNNEAGIYYL